MCCSMEMQRNVRGLGALGVDGEVVRSRVRRPGQVGEHGLVADQSFALARAEEVRALGGRQSCVLPERRRHAFDVGKRDAEFGAHLGALLQARLAARRRRAGRANRWACRRVRSIAQRRQVSSSSGTGCSGWPSGTRAGFRAGSPRNRRASGCGFRREARRAGCRRRRTASCAPPCGSQTEIRPPCRRKCRRR